MIRALPLIFLAVALLVGCRAHKEKALGSPFRGTPVSIALARSTNAGAYVVLHGTMTEKCPVAGCWFVLRDESGTIKVNTKNAGFVVVDLPRQTSLDVAGRVVKNGTESALDATGARY